MMQDTSWAARQTAGAKPAAFPVLRAELAKLRRAPIWVAYLAVPLISAAIGTFNYQMNLQLLTHGWDDLWTQHTLFGLMFFLPALAGAGCSWQMRLEHAGGNWNHLLAQPVAPWRVMAAKVAVGQLLLAASLCATGVLFAACGKGAGIAGWPSFSVAGQLALAWAGGAAVVAVQLAVSLAVRNFAAPVGVALAGSIAGMLATARGWGLAWPWALLALGANANGHGALPPDQLPAFFAAAAIYVALALAASVIILRRR